MEKQTIFISYSHKDSKWKDMLLIQLKATQSSRIILWDDTMIQTGEDWLADIYHNISLSSIAILLISSDYLASDFIQKSEIPRMLLRHNSGGLRLLPLIVRPCLWKNIDWLSILQAKPLEGNPISSLSDNDAEICLSSIAEEIVEFSKHSSTSYLPETGSMLVPSIPYEETRLIGLKLNDTDPLCLTFIMTLGDDPNEKELLYSNASTLVDYFLTCLSLPEKELWVNLSPSEKSKVMPDVLSKTRMGKDLLAQDYLLKQFNASLMYPELSVGKRYWETAFKKMEERNLDPSEVAVNTFNKVWIVPETAKVSQFGGVAIIVDASLDVLVEEDYQSQNGSISNEIFGNSEEIYGASTIGLSSFSECLLPEIKNEVNTGCYFATTRQIFHSLILSSWYKSTVKESLLNDVYTDKEKLSSLEEKSNGNYSTDIYDKYVESLSKGVFNFIREDKDMRSGDIIVRKYYSGGILASAIKEKLEIGDSESDIHINNILGRGHKCFLIKVRLDVSGKEGPKSGKSVYDSNNIAGIDLSKGKIETTKYNKLFSYKLDIDLKQKLLSEEFKGFTAKIENIVKLDSINEIAD